MRIYGKETPTTIALAERLANIDVSLRWGGDMVDGAINGKVHLLNGLEQLQKFKASGIPTVFWVDTVDSRDAYAGKYLLLGRKLNHTQGFDIAVPGSMKTNLRWQQRDFWTVFEPSTGEWRVHVVKFKDGTYRSIARAIKYVPEDFTHPQAPGLMGEKAADAIRPKLWKEKGVIVRSRRLGWHMRHDVKIPENIRDLAKQAVAAVGYDLGAVDILVSTQRGPLVLEVNSRPAMRDDYTLEAYTRCIRGQYGRRAGGE